MMQPAAQSTRGRNAADWLTMPDDEIERIIKFDEGMSKREAIRASARLRDSVRHAAGLHPFVRPMTIRHIPVRVADLTDHENRTWMGVVRAVARFCGVPEDVITAPNHEMSRRARYVRARALVAVILRNRGFSYPRIGAWLGSRDSSTIINSVRRIVLADDERALVAALSPVVAEVLP